MRPTATDLLAAFQEAVRMMTGRQRRSFGSYGERVAARHLVDGGMTVIDRNWTCHAGELDLVLRDGDVLVFCEVKTRRDQGRGHPVEAVDPRKAERLRLLAALWLEAHRVVAPRIRIDAVGVLQPGRGPAVVTHLVGIC